MQCICRLCSTNTVYIRQEAIPFTVCHTNSSIQKISIYHALWRPLICHYMGQLPKTNKSNSPCIHNFNDKQQSRWESMCMYVPSSWNSSFLICMHTNRQDTTILAPLKTTEIVMLSFSTVFAIFNSALWLICYKSLILVLYFHVTIRYSYRNHIVPHPPLHKVADFGAFYQDGFGPLQSSAPLNLKIMCCS